MSDAKKPLGGPASTDNTAEWIKAHEDALDYPDSGNPFRDDIAVPVPPEVEANLMAIRTGTMPRRRFYLIDRALFRVEPDGSFARSGPDGWLVIEGAKLRLDHAIEVSPDVALDLLAANSPKSEFDSEE